MSYRRSGGGVGGFQRGNRSFSQPNFQGGVNPWQGNAGSSYQGIISQITTNPQQLALALTNLLQPQQNNPPSLLSLNTSPAFSNQDSVSRFGGRSRDFRRHEPYSKNRSGGWRQSDKGRGGRKDGKRDFKDKDKKKDANKDSASKDEKTNDSTDDIKKGDEDSDKHYSGIPSGLLHCFVCNKNMWDGLSFFKHIKGRAHKQMLECLDESFHTIVNILRESMRLTEEKRLIELNRIERLNKKHRKFEPQSTCNMCDLKFLGKIVVHRKTEGHQRLKRFLHPNCDVCDKEFSSRMDWVEHRLTEEHLRSLGDYLEKKRDPEDGNTILETEENDSEEIIIDESASKDDDDNTVLELCDDLTDLDDHLPTYKKDRPVGTESLKAVLGFLCNICNRSFATEELSQLHLKSQRHYHNFVNTAKDKYKEQLLESAQKKNTQEKEEEENEAAESDDANENEKTEENGDDTYDPEEACKEDESMDASETTTEEKKSDAVAEDKDDAKNEVKTEVEAEADAVKEETPKQAPAATKPVRKATAAANVKSAPGPKSKKPRK